MYIHLQIHKEIDKQTGRLPADYLLGSKREAVNY